MKKFTIESFVDLLNIFDLLGICFVILLALIFQFTLHELPCPLCLLQRLGILAIGFGFLLNIHYYPRPLHYALSCLAALFTASVAVRQILLHIVPGTGSYGLPFLGLHLYTWVFIFSFMIILSTAIILSVPEQYNKKYLTLPKPPLLRRLSSLVFIIFIILLLANITSTFLECGLKTCNENPVAYQL